MYRVNSCGITATVVVILHSTDATMDLWSYVNMSTVAPGLCAYVSMLDINYMRWVLWLLYPIILSFLLPLILATCFLFTILFLHFYSYRHGLRQAYAKDFWHGARQTLAVLWDFQGYIWHGYEVEGFENVPSTGAALLIYYHGVIPIDVYYVVASCIIHKGRTIRAIGDRFLFKLPFVRILMEAFKVFPGTVQSCINLLNEGHILAIAPGGLREALFGDETYQMMWSKRVGFAKVALKANVPVIPMFTQNIRETFRTPSWSRNILRKLYEKTRWPLLPIYGGFPVKLKTIFGEPIYPDQSESPEQFAKKVECKLQELINHHQRIPGSILHSLLDRIVWRKSKQS
ncbi:transmembrane protein 68-like [Argonauta hians]